MSEEGEDILVIDGNASEEVGDVDIYDIDNYNLSVAMIPRPVSLLKGRKWSDNQIVVDGMKGCSACGERKRVKEFSPSKRDGLNSACDACMVKRWAGRYEKDRQARIAANGYEDGRAEKGIVLRKDRHLNNDEEFCKICGPKPRSVFSKSGMRGGVVRYKNTCNDCRKEHRSESKRESKLRSTNIQQYKDDVLRLALLEILHSGMQSISRFARSARIS